MEVKFYPKAYGMKSFTVALDMYGDDGVKGSLYHDALIEAVDFDGLYDCTRKIEAILDHLGNTRSAQNKRNMPAYIKDIDAASKNARFNDSISKKIKNDKSDAPSAEARKGKLTTLKINIKYRQNASWQGILHVDGADKEYTFESFLSLVDTIDDIILNSKVLLNEKTSKPSDKNAKHAVTGNIKQTIFDRELCINGDLDIVRCFNDLRCERLDMAKTGKRGNILPDHVVTIHKAGGGGQTFTVKIRFCEHESMQGSMTWKEAKQTLNYRSFLEIYLCINSILESGIKAICED